MATKKSKKTGKARRSTRDQGSQDESNFEEHLGRDRLAASRGKRAPRTDELSSLENAAINNAQRQEPGTGTSPAGNERRTRRMADYSPRARTQLSNRRRLEAAQEALDEKDAVEVVAMRVGYYGHKRR